MFCFKKRKVRNDQEMMGLACKHMLQTSRIFSSVADKKYFVLCKFLNQTMFTILLDYFNSPVGSGSLVHH